MTTTKKIAVLGVLLIFFLMLAAFAIHNYEFVYYSFLLIPFAIFIYVLEQKIHFPFYVFCLIFLVFILHAAGGVLYLDGTRLYDTSLWIIKYDNMVHFLGSLAASLVMYSLLFHAFHAAWTKYKGLAFLLIVLATAGAGTIVEIIEFAAVVVLPETARVGVGGYTNNALDLVVNLVAACLGACITVVYHRKHRE